MRGVSNLFFGVALGLAGYYSLTTGIGWLEQRELDEAAAPLGAIGAPEPGEYVLPSSETTQGPVLDFDFWKLQDLDYWSGLSDGDVWGRIVIDAIGVDAIVVNGTSRADLQKGPGWIDWSSLPGPEGTVGIAGHRTTYGAWFRNIDQLQPGDTIDLYSSFRLYRYEVEETVIVTPDRGDVLDDVDYPRLGLSACHPPFSARYRIVVLAKLVEARRLTDEPITP